MKEFELNLQHISLEELFEIINKGYTVKLGKKAINKVRACREYLDNRLSQKEEIIYGVNTGFGSLYSTSISKNDLAQLQINLVRSHACGTGNRVPRDIVKIMLLLKAIGLSFGHSGVQVNTIERILFYYNNNILPVIYEQGSLGASGDLAPLAHLALSLIGEGEVVFENKVLKTSEILSKFNLEPVSLKSKEGLALLNGTQFMSSYLAYSVYRGKKTVGFANKISALSLEAYDGRIEPFTKSVNAIRNQEGQIKVAAEIEAYLIGSELIKQTKKHVQDPYCLRCIPQVHGASLDALIYAEQIVTREINAVTDNPTIFPDEDSVISAGNFHGQPLAITLDFLAIALAEIGSISERRVYKLLGGQRDLPAFLVANPGLNSGFMIAQYTAASIVSQNKQLCTPASIDTIDSSNGQEDHVSMGANAATKLHRVIENITQVLGIELMTASQAIEFRGAERTSADLKNLFSDFRREIPFISEDRFMSELLLKSKSFIENNL
ncbi:MAG: histidine ammonia-lyase [Brumimicrobium sp.]|nr:histidine ammonia-lyase [Brumimicrobium sp.]